MKLSALLCAAFVVLIAAACGDTPTPRGDGSDGSAAGARNGVSTSGCRNATYYTRSDAEQYNTAATIPGTVAANNYSFVVQLSIAGIGVCNNAIDSLFGASAAFVSANSQLCAGTGRDTSGRRKSATTEIFPDDAEALQVAREYESKVKDYISPFFEGADEPTSDPTSFIFETLVGPLFYSYCPDE